MSESWSVLPHLVVRTTGFPLERLEELRCVSSARLARDLIRHRAALEHYKATAPRINKPPKAVLSALRNNREVPLDQVPNPADFAEWNRLAAAVRECEAALEDRLPPEQAQAVASLAKAAQEPRLQEAVASSSPPVYLDLVAGRWSSRMERQLASYLQRLCGKNETMSFFGPINYGLLVPGAGEGIDFQWPGPEVLRARNTYVAAWLAQGLARQISRDPEILPWLVLRRKGFLAAPSDRNNRVQLGEMLIREGLLAPSQLRAALAQQTLTPEVRLGELLVRAGYCTREDVERLVGQQAHVGATPADAHRAIIPRLVAKADGTRNLRTLCEHLSLTLEQGMEFARIGCDRGLLSHQLEIPSAAPHPLHELADRLAGIPVPAARRHLQGLQEVFAHLRAYSAAPTREKVAINEALAALVKARWDVDSPSRPGATPPAPTPAEVNPPVDAKRRELRGDGHNFYADRLPLREECGGELRLEIRGARARELQERSVLALEVMSAAAERTRQAARQRVAQLLGQRRLPFWKAIAALSDRPIPFDDTFALQAVEEIAQAAPGTRVLDLSGLARRQAPAPSTLPTVTSIDLLVSAPSVEAWAAGDYGLVLGDVHDTALVAGWALQFHPERARVEQDLLALLGGAARQVPLITALASRRTGLLPSEFPGPVVEVGGVSSRASPWRLYLDDLWVESDGVTSRLWADSLQSEVCLYNGELESLVHTAFALPRVRMLRVPVRGGHAPRLTLGGAVFQREQWVLTAEARERLLATKTDRDRLLAAAELAEALQLPELLFAKFEGERKPVLVDLASPLNLRVFFNLLQQKDSVVLSEMYPGPAGLWMAAASGHHTSELRAVFIKGGAEG